ncbi:MAG: P1 family peptidase [Planctomycetota bacterium]
MHRSRSLLAISLAVTLLAGAAAQDQDASRRARDLGIPFGGTPGEQNAITDVEGVQVGHSTILSEDEGANAARTGVTAIRANLGGRNVFAAVHSHNGDGEMTGRYFVFAPSARSRSSVMVAIYCD